MREVVGTAYNHLTWDKDGMPKVVFFFAVLSSLVFSLIATLYFLAGFFIAPAHAGIFDNVLGAADISNRWLDYMFQTTAGATFQNQVPSNTGGAVITQTIGNNVPLAFRTLAAMYSTAMLILAALILIYHLISMVVHTAHDGRVMGKAAHQIWAPVRLIFALGLLIPVANGFSSGQWLVLQIAKLGSNLASNVWRDPNVGARVTGTPTVFTSMPDLDADQTIDTLVNIGYCAKKVQLKTAATPNIGALFGTFNAPSVPGPGRTLANAANVADINNALLFNTPAQPQQAIAVNLRRNAVVAGSGVSTVAGVNSKIYYPVSPVLPGATYTMPHDINPCGSVVFPSLADDGAVAAADPAWRATLQGIATAHARAFNAIEQRALQTGATHFVATEFGGNCLATPGNAASCANSSGVNVTASKNLLKTGPGGYRATFIANLPAGVTVNGDGKLVFTNTPTPAQAATLAGGCGWMCASGWFASLASKHNAFGKSAQMVPSLKANCETADCGEDTIRAQQEQEEKPLGAALKDWISNLGINPMDWFKGIGMAVLRSVGLANNNDQMIWHTQFTSASPVSDMIAMGNILVDGAVTLLIVGVVLNLGGAVGSMIDGGKNGTLSNNTGGTVTGSVVSKLLKFLPTGRIMQIVGKGMQFGSMLAPLFFGLAAMMFVPGVMLFYLLPFLPFINFMTGVITWLISLLQAVVAIPVIAIAHITPNGEGLPSSAARGAYTMILQIFLRPVMMIFGMLVCVLIMNTGIGFLNVVFFNIYKNNLLGAADGLLSNIIFMGLYTATAWGIVNAAVTAIDDFPLKAVTWIGGGQGVDTNHDFGRFGQAMVGAMAGQGFGQMTRAAQGISSAPSQMLGNAGSANMNADAASLASQRHSQLSTQNHNLQMQNAGHYGNTTAQGQIAQAQGNAAILPGGNAGNGGMTPPPPPSGPGPSGPAPALGGPSGQPALGGPSGQLRLGGPGGNSGGSVVPSSGGPSPAGGPSANLGGGFQRMTPQQSAAARNDGRTIDMPTTGGQGGPTIPFGRGGVNPAVAGNIRAAAAGRSGSGAGVQSALNRLRARQDGAVTENAIRAASQRTGVPLDYMLLKAQQESGFSNTVRAGTSSATGLYQFLDNTWLGMIKRHGAEYGLGNMASQITQNRNGTYSVSDPAMRQEILALRTNANVSAAMGAEFAADNKEHLERQGFRVGNTELYMAHFLGAGGATTFLRALNNNPNASAADMMPEAAAANRSVFYDASGRERSVAEIYQNFSNRMGDSDGSGGTMVAAAPGGIDPGSGGGSSGGGLSGAAHTILGLASFVPGLNIVASGIDGIIYTVEGDYANAALAGVGMIPGGKWVTTGGKLLRAGKVSLAGAGKMARLDRGMNALSGGGGGSGSGRGSGGSDNDYDPYSTILYASALRHYLMGKRTNAPAKS